MKRDRRRISTRVDHRLSLREVRRPRRLTDAWRDCNRWLGVGEVPYLVRELVFEDVAAVQRRLLAQGIKQRWYA